MTFHYDFLLKTLQGNNLDWIRLMRQSYWYKRHQLYMSGISTELATEERKLAGFHMTAEEIAGMREREDLAVKMKGAVNAAKRDVQRAWSVWENTHMGPRWQEVMRTVWPAWNASLRAVAQLKGELAAAEDPSRGVLPSLHALEAMGLLKGMELTPLGIMATEVNEGHAVLMAQAYEQGLLSRLGPEEILAVLMAFTEESGRDMPPVNSLEVPRSVIDALWDIHRMGEENQQLERSVGAPRPPRDSYWELNTTWVEPVWRWLQGATIQQICTDYECYEGNLMRLLAKCGNLLEEWRSLATLAADTEMLEKMRGIETAITRGAGAADSLYLRL